MTKYLTRQEIANKIAERLTDGKGRCALSDDSTQCMYLNEHGNKCAVGIFIPDRHPAQDYMGSVYGLAKTFPDALPNIAPKDFVFLGHFQSLHDRISSWTADGRFSLYGFYDFMEIADKFGLECPPALVGYTIK